MPGRWLPCPLNSQTSFWPVPVPVTTAGCGSPSAAAASAASSCPLPIHYRPVVKRCRVLASDQATSAGATLGAHRDELVQPLCHRHTQPVALRADTSHGTTTPPASPSPPASSRGVFSASPPRAWLPGRDRHPPRLRPGPRVQLGPDTGSGSPGSGPGSGLVPRPGSGLAPGSGSGLVPGPARPRFRFGPGPGCRAAGRLVRGSGGRWCRRRRTRRPRRGGGGRAGGPVAWLGPGGGRAGPSS